MLAGVSPAPKQGPQNAVFTTAPEEERAGLGFAVMQSFCDKVKVKSELDKGTIVTLEKVITKND